MSGWIRVDGHWWADVAAALPTPWPRGAVLADLRFWAGEVATYRATGGRAGRPKRPGRSALAKRWGWTPKRVRTVIAGGGWEDPYLTPGPVEGQSRASRGPVEGQKPAPNRPEPLDPGASRGPVEGQSRASRGPPARDVPSPPPSTGHRLKGSGAPPAAPPPDRVEVVNPPAPPPGRRRPSKRAPSKPSSDYHRAIRLWDQEYLLAYPEALAGYPWRFGGRDADGARVKSWLGGVQRLPADQRDPALQGAIRAYLQAVRAGTAWPAGEPPSTRIFTRDLSRWLQAGQGVQGGAGGQNGRQGGGALERARRARERTKGPAAGRGGTVIDATFR